MKFFHKIRQLGECILLCLGLLVFPFLPRPALLRLARWLGTAAFHVDTRSRNIALANLDSAFGPALPAADKEAVVRRSFHVFAQVMLDLFWFSAFARKRILAHVTLDDSFRHYLDTEPVIAVTAHFGNWEVMGQAASAHGRPSVSVMAPLENPFATWILKRFRGATGQQVAEREGAVRTLIRALRHKGRVALLMDQNTLPEEGGVFVPFFGLPVPVSKAVHALSAHTGAAIVLTFCRANPDGSYTAFARPPLPPARADDPEEKITGLITNVVEEEIRKHPEQWLWMYKRWKFVPPGAPRDKYPYYAKPYERKTGP